MDIKSLRLKDELIPRYLSGIWEHKACKKIKPKGEFEFSVRVLPPLESFEIDGLISVEAKDLGIAGVHDLESESGYIYLESDEAVAVSAGVNRLGHYVSISGSKLDTKPELLQWLADLLGLGIAIGTGSKPKSTDNSLKVISEFPRDPPPEGEIHFCIASPDWGQIIILLGEERDLRSSYEELMRSGWTCDYNWGFTPEQYELARRADIEASSFHLFFDGECKIDLLQPAALEGINHCYVPVASCVLDRKRNRSAEIAIFRDNRESFLVATLSEEAHLADIGEQAKAIFAIFRESGVESEFIDEDNY